VLPECSSVDAAPDVALPPDAHWVYIEYMADAEGWLVARRDGEAWNHVLTAGTPHARISAYATCPALKTTPGGILRLRYWERDA
jgi:hypothetical protein